MPPDTIKREHERQRKKAAATAAAEREIALVPPADLGRRRACLADPFEFMPVYFGSIFCQPFNADRRSMVDSIIHAASYSGDYATAAPRGEGKSKIALFTALWLDLKCRLQLPIIIGKNQAGAENELDNLKLELTNNKKFLADFPEIAAPLIALCGWASTARKQTVGGHLTRIGWAKDCLFLPTIPNEALPPKWPTSEPSLACGQGMAVVGIDGKIRGFNRRNIRPDLAIIDDIDDRESARSVTQTADHERAIEQDIVGLAGSGHRVARVMLCTIINGMCVAAKYTVKPSWRGQRFKMLVNRPAREDLWDEYIDLRCNRDHEDPDARAAHRLYLSNRAEMDRGAVVSNECAFENKPGADGEPLEVSALQACYNLIADIGWEAFNCEYQSDPPPVEVATKSGLTKTLIQSRLSGLGRSELPPDSTIVVGIDIGKLSCHWVAGAFRNGGNGSIVQYGIIEVSGAEETSQKEIVERAILRALLQWKDEISSLPFRDANGNPVEISKVLFDSGYCPDAVCEFVRRYGEPYRACKGIGGGRFQHGTRSHTRQVGNHWFGQVQDDRSWLYSLDADFWKRAVHDRFTAEPLDESNRPRPGSLTLFIPAGKRDHHTFAAHILAEEWITEFLAGKGDRSRFVVHSNNNHFLDATALMLAGAEMSGCGIFSPIVSIEPRRHAVISAGRTNEHSRW